MKFKLWAPATLALATALTFNLPTLAQEASGKAPMKKHGPSDGHMHNADKHQGHKGHQGEQKGHKGHGDQHHGDAHEAKADHATHHPKAAHGGVVLEIDKHHGELVAKDGKITLYISDHDGHAATGKDFSATAMVLGAQGRQGPIKLAATTDNKLESSVPVKTEPGSRIVITLKDPHGHMAQARYQMP
ncbi:MAG: hypothetical protein L3J67_05075 [Hyphomicrobiaceae bacterium]|nr:hypothetical protein [Hyphomicrobiaceae bacterium]